MLLLLIVPIDDVVVDCSDQRRLEGTSMLDGDWKGRGLEVMTIGRDGDWKGR